MSDLKEMKKGFDFNLKDIFKKDTDLMLYSEFTLHSSSQIIIWEKVAGHSSFLPLFPRKQVQGHYYVLYIIE